MSDGIIIFTARSSKLEYLALRRYLNQNTDETNMTWFTNFLTSSIGRKVVMSLTGLFLITFLVVHLIGNLQLLADDGGESFNIYAKFMTSNPLIKFASIGLYAGIILHAWVGILLWLKNKQSKGQNYKVKTGANATWASKNMALLGTLILAFLCIHMGDFWFKMKFTDQVPLVTYASIDYEVKDLYYQVSHTFRNPLLVVVYVVGMIVLGFHLWHGFASAFQTLGLSHKKYTPIISMIGKIYAVIIPLAFAAIPLIYFFTK
jgi:succinate dehydrogenase / fumarate reductase cytochrome b subunit